MHRPIPECPVETAILLIGSRWKALILRELLFAPQAGLRYCELKKNIIGISDKMLSQSLRDMEQDSLLDRQVVNSAPPGVLYSLTPVARKLEPLLQAMFAWGQEYQRAMQGAATVCPNCARAEQFRKGELPCNNITLPE